MPPIGTLEEDSLAQDVRTSRVLEGYDPIRESFRENLEPEHEFDLNTYVDQYDNDCSSGI